jgi:hypothetical protein
MFDVAASLNDAVSLAQRDLNGAASATARAQTALGGTRVDAAMAGVARKAIFSEALLNAVHARLAEIKNVTHG